MSKSKEEVESIIDKQYTEENIRKYEAVFGKQFVSTGGETTMTKFTEMLNLKPKEHVLDFGSGLGASACYMANHYGITVCGVDASKNMISRAENYLKTIKDERIKTSVQFKLCDETNIYNDYFASETFDCIYSRETLVHVEQKAWLLKTFHHWMKPGGRVLISDYCKGCPDSFSDDFLQYIQSRKYFMITIPEYTKLIENAGFIDVKSQDLTQDCIKILEKNLEDLYVKKHDILNEITRFEYDELVAAWQSKLQRCVSGNQAYGLFTAIKA